MKITPLLFIALVVAGILLVTNILIAVAWFRDPKNRGRGVSSRDERSIDELHQRVEKLRNRKE